MQSHASWQCTLAACQFLGAVVAVLRVADIDENVCKGTGIWLQGWWFLNTTVVVDLQPHACGNPQHGVLDHLPPNLRLRLCLWWLSMCLALPQCKHFVGPGTGSSCSVVQGSQAMHRIKDALARWISAELPQLPGSSDVRYLLQLKVDDEVACCNKRSAS